MIRSNVVITEYRNRICAFHFQDNKLKDLHVETKDALLQSIYIAKVKNISRNINAAFVELFNGQMAFLPLDDIKDCTFLHSSDGKLREGDEIPVQVIRESGKTKDPVVTTKFSINGAYVAVSLNKKNGHLQYSKKLSLSKKQEISRFLEDLVLPERYSFIIRTSVGDLQDYSVVCDEIRYLIQKMDEIFIKADTRTCFSCIYRGKPAYVEYLHHVSDDVFEEIVTDLPDVYTELQSRYKGNAPIRFYEDTFPLMKLYSIESKMDELFSRYIYLKSGGSIVIDYTEAMTVIDVNTGKCIADKNKEELHYQINAEAAVEIGRQLRLRNLSGIIIVDFINMEKQELEDKLILELKRILKSDSVPCNFVDMTRLGLVEITRKKVNKPVHEEFRIISRKNT